jgi:hypothetical protein
MKLVEIFLRRRAAGIREKMEVLYLIKIHCKDKYQMNPPI